jgi:predicted permease
MTIVNALFPVLALLIFGVALKRGNITDSSFLRTSDRLIYYVFFPVMLFWKIGGAPLAFADGWRYLVASALAVAGVFLASLLVIRLRPVGRFQAGSFSQGCYRFNTYIGMAVVLNALGEEGARLYGILVGLLIPLINVMAVSVLIWFGEEQPRSNGRRLLVTGRHLVANPLILGCVCGMAWGHLVGSFPVWLDNTLRLIAQVTLPMALFSIGGSLTFAGLRAHFGLALTSSLIKLALLPLLGLFCLHLFGVTGTAWSVSMLFFALPTSTAIYILSSQLRSDLELASAVIVLSTLLSFVSMSLVLLVAA